MQNSRASGRILDLVMAATQNTSGVGVLVGTIFAVTTTVCTVGDTIPCLTEGVFTLPKLTTDVCTQGADLYWDDTNHRLTLTSNTGANQKVGQCHVAAGGTATTVEAWIHPRV